MSPRGRPKRWTRLRRIASTLDSLPSWVMVLVALACLLLAIWLLLGTQGSGLGHASGIDHTTWTLSLCAKDGLATRWVRVRRGLWPPDRPADDDRRVVGERRVHS